MRINTPFAQVRMTTTPPAKRSTNARKQPAPKRRRTAATVVDEVLSEVVVTADLPLSADAVELLRIAAEMFVNARDQ